MQSWRAQTKWTIPELDSVIQLETEFSAHGLYEVAVDYLTIDEAWINMNKPSTFALNWRPSDHDTEQTNLLQMQVLQRETHLIPELFEENGHPTE